MVTKKDVHQGHVMMTEDNIRKIQRSIDKDHERELADIFSTLSDPSRLCIIRMLLRNRCLCVTETAEILGVSLSAASQQLKILSVVGLVKRDRSGKIVCYAIDQDNPVIPALKKLLCGGHCGK